MLVVLLATFRTFTVKVLSLVVAGQAPLAGIVYRTVTFVLLDTLGGVYVLPEILPPPLTTLHVPPPGVPVRAFVLFSQMDAVLVVLFATFRTFTVKVLSLGVPQASVYLTVTLVLLDTFGGVYVVPEILPPPLTILHVPPPAEAVKVFVPFSQIGAVLVVLVPDVQAAVKTTSSM